MALVQKEGKEHESLYRLRNAHEAENGFSQ